MIFDEVEDEDIKKSIEYLNKILGGNQIEIKEDDLKAYISEFVNYCEKVKDIVSSGPPKKLFISVRPDFRDSKSILGFYNPITGEYQYTTDIIKFISEAINEYLQQENPSPYIILFDEMNLARVEYYLADFLSAMESKRIENFNNFDSKNDFTNDIKSILDFVCNGTKNIDLNNINEDKFIGFYSKPIEIHNEEKDPNKNYHQEDCTYHQIYT